MNPNNILQKVEIPKNNFPEIYQKKKQLARKIECLPKCNKKGNLSFYLKLTRSIRT